MDADMMEVVYDQDAKSHVWLTLSIVMEWNSNALNRRHPAQ
jgi:hypothetical protein